MKSILKKIVKKTICFFLDKTKKTRIGPFLYQQIATNPMEKVLDVFHGDLKLKFVVPNQVCEFRALTFSTKEPETLEWIDSIPDGSILWDIGANVGLYTCYAAKKRNCTVYAFEPSVFNLELLARNLYINNLSESVTIIPIPLSDSLQISTLNMTSIEWGGALSSFGQLYGDNGMPMNKIFEFKTIGITMEDAINNLGIPYPEYVKMDVDGIEHLIIKGGVDVLRKVKGLLIEVNEDFKKQAEDVREILEFTGLVLKEKRHSEMFEGSLRFGHSYNQIWHRPL